VRSEAHSLHKPRARGEHRAIEARLRERWNRWEYRLAAAIAEDIAARPGDPWLRVAAAALTGAIRVAADEARHRPRDRKRIAARAFNLLASDLSRYGVLGRPGYIRPPKELEAQVTDPSIPHRFRAASP
jgi:hypothetical protein